MKNTLSQARRACGKIFISYRRDGGADLARLVRDNLQQRGYDVFMDVENLRSGPFNTALFDEIASATDVVVVLTPGSLVRCQNDGDWMRLEITHAIQQKRNVVPLLARGFEWPAPSSLPEDLSTLPTYNGVSPSHEYFDASLDKLAKLLIGRPKRRRWRPYQAAAVVAFVALAGVALLPLLRRGPVAVQSPGTGPATGLVQANAERPQTTSATQPALLPIVVTTEQPAIPVSGYRLAWSDEFDGTELDATKWGNAHGPWLNEGDGWDGITVSGGYLTVRAFTENDRHFGVSMSTRGKFESSFGYYEARIRFQDAPGVTSAFWSAPPHSGKPVRDPASEGVQIDISEHRAADKTGRNIANKTQLGVQWGGEGRNDKPQLILTDDLGLASGFHTYGLEWTAEEYRFFVDGKLISSVPPPISTRAQHLYLHTLVQGGWAGKIPGGGYGSRETSATKMVVDYVRFYERVGQGR